MIGQTNYIVFLCYGNEGVFYECAYSLLSLSRTNTAEQLTGTEVWIYTDNPAWFALLHDCSIPLHFRTLDSNTIKQWRGKIDFVHRIKIEALKDFTKERNGNILYTDTDVAMTQGIGQVWQNINAGELYMHVNEGTVSNRGNAMLAKLDSYLQNGSHIVVNGKALNHLAMWNAGAMGFNTKYRHLLDEVLTFTDTEYPKFPKHVVEQFAFSVYFQQAGPVKSLSPYMLHYWNLKEARQVLASFFIFFKDRKWDDLVRYSGQVQMPVLMQEKGNYFQTQTIADKLSKKKWVPSIPDWSTVTTQV